MKSGIYSITSPSGRKYIGSAVDFTDRWWLHRNKLRKGQHHNAPLQAAYRKYGEDQLIFQKLIICSREDLLFYEQLFIDALKPEYNMCKVAGSTRGMKHGPMKDSHRENLRAALTGKKKPEGYGAKVSALKKGVSLSPETRAKMSAVRKGRLHGPRKQSAKVNISAALTSSGFRGVSFHKATGKWRAFISIDRKARHIGMFDDAQKAFAVAQMAEAAPNFDAWLSEYRARGLVKVLEVAA